MAAMLVPVGLRGFSHWVAWLILVLITPAWALAADAPRIMSYTAVTVGVGKSYSFTAQVTGTAPLTYQWSKFGSALPGATTATLSIASITESDAGNYQLMVRN